MEKLQIISIPITKSDNLLNWTDSELMATTNNRVVVGYLLKVESKNSKLNIYVIKESSLSDPSKIITLSTLKLVILQWLDSLNEDTKSYMFRNPPLEEWLDSKDNWLKGTSYKLSQSYGKPMDECLSTLHMVILASYNAGNIYLGNLYFLIVSVNNAIRKEHYYMKNRLYGGHPDAIHLDAQFSDISGYNDNITSLHEVINGETLEDLAEQRNYEILQEMLDDLREDFSQREIDQILNTPGFLPMSLYRRLLKWRKSHKLEDYL